MKYWKETSGTRQDNKAKSINITSHDKTSYSLRKKKTMASTEEKTTDTLFVIKH